jgi:membrane protease YdiL (CAAX protease family)
MQVNHIHFIENYIDPVIHHPVSQLAFRMVVEVVKIVAAKVFLEFLGKQFLNQVAKITPREIHIMTVFAPVVEEIIFRGVLLRGIQLTQKAWNWNDNRNDLTDEEEATQLKFRVRASALIFAAAHLMNPHKNIYSALIQFTWTFIGGLTYGYLSEKYKTLSVGILAHGLNNSLAVAASIYPAHLVPAFLLAVFINKLGAYVLAVTTIDEVVFKGVVQMTNFCTALPGRVMSHVIPQDPIEVIV